jgi:CarboxypepD_reg-like domain
MRTCLKLILFSIWLLWKITSFELIAQSTEYITGRVINSSTSEPIPFATIALKINNIGIYANADGDFRIIRKAQFQSDSLIITCIGFKRTAILFRALKENLVNRIYLLPAVSMIGEVEIVGLTKNINVRALIRKAIRRIPENYPVHPFNYVAYYRDFQKKDKEYINLNEAIVQNSDNGFDKKPGLNKSRLLDFKSNMDFKRMDISPYYDTSAYKASNPDNKFIPGAKLPDYGGNEFFILLAHDAIRNYKISSFSFIYVFSRDFLRNHVFEEINPVYNDKLLLYKIKFKANYFISRDTLVVSGNIYIQPKNYCIHKLEYSCYYLPKGKAKKEMFSVTIEYGHENAVDSLMHLKYISFNNVFDVADKTDTTYFKILRSDYGRKAQQDMIDISNGKVEPDTDANPILVFEFNHQIDPASARKKENYSITYKNKRTKISKIEVNGRRLTISVNDNKKEFGYYDVFMQNIKDINGRILNVKKTVEYFQYRELFVQEYTNALIRDDTCLLQNISLKENCIAKYPRDQKYWMNTPENINPNADK